MCNSGLVVCAATAVVDQVREPSPAAHLQAMDSIPPTPTVRLTAELVPSTCWWSNMRSNLTPAEWGQCKAFVRKRSGDRCELCGGRGPKWPVECHEVWGYDDVTHVQSLDGLIALCPACHEVKHIGRAETVGRLDQAKNRLMIANGWSPADVEAYLEGVWEVWAQRSKYQWTLDASWLTTIGVAVPVIRDRPAR